jgi:hypothetical protein
MEDKIIAVFAGFLIAVCLSWFPWLMYSIVASVFTVLPDINWMQATFFTWVLATIFFWISP